MSDAILNALPDEPVLQENSIATVTSSYAIVRMARGNAKNIVAVTSIAGARRAVTSYPGLLVIAAGLFLISAAAYASKQGGNAAIPIAVFAVAFVIFYFGSRRASVVLEVEGETVETAQGSLREARAVIRAINKARGAEASTSR